MRVVILPYLFYLLSFLTLQDPKVTNITLLFIISIHNYLQKNTSIFKQILSTNSLSKRMLISLENLHENMGVSEGYWCNVQGIVGAPLTLLILQF